MPVTTRRSKAFAANRVHPNQEQGILDDLDSSLSDVTHHADSEDEDSDWEPTGKHSLHEYNSETDWPCLEKQSAGRKGPAVGPIRSVPASTPVEMIIVLPETEALRTESLMSFRLYLWTSYTRFASHACGERWISHID